MIGEFEDMICDTCGHSWTFRGKLVAKGYLDCPICPSRSIDNMWRYISPESSGGDGSALYPVGWDNENNEIVLN
jgi:hypothetical protein